MRSALLCLLLLVIAGCQHSDEGPHLPPSSSQDDAPRLIGEVVDAGGNPLPGVAVRLYTGIATYWPLADIRTNDSGEFSIPIPGGAILFPEDGPALYSIGVRLESPRLSMPEGGLHWTGQLPSTPGSVKRVRFRLVEDHVKIETDDA